ncbi:hypothetical protein [Maioricimonas rarisocia]|uniref:hypothetical protein n=1 Tax=Maioricimonas rarisocia TaxID=2528026 RepID=UPI0011A89D3E|nr:hypothetical protein [Maioricimonas rarisocia]
MKDVANELLNHRQTLVDAGELSPRTWDDYKAAADLVVSEFGATAPADRLQPHDFARLRKAIDKHNWSGVRTRKFLQSIRTVFKHAYESGLLRQPVRFGPAFKGPSARSLRLERQARGPKMLEADEIRSLLDAAEQPLKAMILLGVNCGFDNADVGRLPQSALPPERRANTPRVLLALQVCPAGSGIAERDVPIRASRLRQAARRQAASPAGTVGESLSDFLLPGSPRVAFSQQPA